MTAAERVLAYFDRISGAPEAIPRLRQFVLDLAVRGKLVDQDPNDEPASELLKSIQLEKQRLTRAGTIRPSASPGGQIHELGFAVRPGWSPVKLGDVLLELQTGPFGSSLHQSDYRAGGRPVVNPASIQGERIVPIAKMAVGPETAERLAGFKLRAGDIVMARRGEMGRCAVVSDNEAGWLCGTGSLILRLPSRIFPSFLVKVFGSPLVRARLESASVGATMQNLNQSILLETAIGLPPFAEQHRIVAKVDELMALCDRLEAAQKERESRRDTLVSASLSRLDKAADNASRREEVRFSLRHLSRMTANPVHLQVLREAVIDAGVVGRLSEDLTDDSILVGGSTLHRRETGTNLPNGWRWIKVSQLVREKLANGLSIPGRDLPPGIAALKLNAIANGEIDTSVVRFLLLDADRAAPLYLQKGDFLVARGNGSPRLVARGGLVRHDPVRPTIFPDTMIRLRLDQGIDSAWFCLVWNSGVVRRQVERVAKTAVGLWKVSQSQVADITVPLPPAPAQRRIVATLQRTTTLLDRLEAQLHAGRAARAALLEATLRDALKEAEVGYVGGAAPRVRMRDGSMIQS